MERYELIKQLGSGSFGRVIKVQSKSENEGFLAIKIIKMANLNEKEKDSALNEIRLLASIDSPNVISYHNAFFDSKASTLNIVMEYADGGDLAGMIKRKRQKAQRFNENFIWQVGYDLLKALKTLHASKIIHRDIKPGNVFFVEGVAKLGDLNISKVTQGGFASTQAGTPYYTAPEIWNGQLYDGKCDIWSLGCLMHECATLRPPFLANDFPSLMKKVNQGYCDPIPTVYSKRLSDLIKSCLRVNPRERPSAAELTLDSVFQYMQDSQQGTVSLLNTIRCPRVLKMIQQKLPEGKSLKKNDNLKKNHEIPTETVQPHLKSPGSHLRSPGSHLRSPDSHLRSPDSHLRSPDSYHRPNESPKQSSRLFPAPFQIRKLISEDKNRPKGIGIGVAFLKQNETNKPRPRQQSIVDHSPLPSRGILCKQPPQSANIKQRYAVSPTIYRRIV